MGELRKYDEPDGQERRAATHGGVDHREHAVGVSPHLCAIDRVRQISLARGD
jgi:hypothetical protein